MNNLLGFYPFIRAIITISLIIGICSFNMYILVRHRKSYFTIFIYLASFFAVGSLFFHLMSSAVFVLSLSKTYYQIGRLSFLLMLASVIVGLIIIFVRGPKRNYKHLSPNILNALSNIEDIVFVIDRDGAITHINHPKKYTSLFGDIDHIDQLISFMEVNYSLDKSQLTIPGANSYYSFKITPIVINKASPLGYTAVLEDVSAIKNSEKLLQERNESLKEANEKLSTYVEVAGELDAEKERLKLLNHIQETLINDIEKVLLNYGKVKNDCFEDFSYPRVMKDIANQLREVYSTVRQAVNRIAGKDV